MKIIYSMIVAFFVTIIFSFTAHAELHTNTFIGNGRTFVDLNRSITRGGKEYPVFYTSKEDVFAFSFDYVVAEMRVMDADKDIATRLGVEYTSYNDLGITLFIAHSPMEVTELYKKLKDEPAIVYVELALFEAHPDMKKFVVVLDDVESPIGNKLLWFTEW